jgi:serine/threonine protein kinase
VDIASALVFLHSKGLVHLDVKSLNILLKGNRMEAKLADLGLSKMVPDGHLSLMNTLPGTPAYSAPEVIGAQLQWRLRTMGRRDQFKTEVATPLETPRPPRPPTAV